MKAQLEGCGRGVCREVTLEDNWRSLANIVNFNNAFFRYAADYLDRELPGGGNQVSEIYSTASQNVRCGKEGEGRLPFPYAVIRPSWEWYMIPWRD